MAYPKDGSKNIDAGIGREVKKRTIFSSDTF